MHFYVIVYSVVFIIGLLVGFSFNGMAVLAASVALSLFSTYVWNDAVFANVVSYICLGISAILFINKEP
jgi:uncharacterized membrane protein YdfJ with MMPL/SSD domain